MCHINAWKKNYQLMLLIIYSSSTADKTIHVTYALGINKAAFKNIKCNPPHNPSPPKKKHNTKNKQTKKQTTKTTP